MGDPNENTLYGPWRPVYPRLAGEELFDVYLQSVRAEDRIGAIRSIFNLRASPLSEIVKLVYGVLGGGPQGLIATSRTIEEAVMIKKYVEAGYWTALQQRITRSGRRSTRSGDLELVHFPQPPDGETCCTVSYRPCRKDENETIK